MKFWSFVAFFICIFVAQSQGKSPLKNSSMPAREPAQWTVMAYMNGRNNDLQLAALCDFYEMLAAHFSSSINLVVELSLDGDLRSHKGLTDVPCQKIEPFELVVPYWRGTRRFQIRDNKVVAPKMKPRTSDLGNPKALEEFVQWSRKRFPAKHYMLILWSHGDAIPRVVAVAGALADILNNLMGSPESRVDPQSFQADRDDKFHQSNDGGAISMYKSGRAHILLNSEIRDSLKRALKSDKLDIVGFDACAKGLIETAFAMSDVANVMVASEELVPEGGWDYYDWLTRLDAAPNISPAELGNLLVESYRELYQQDSNYNLTTLASLDLTRLMDSIRQIDLFAELLLQRQKLWNTIAKARCSLRTYQFQAIDFIGFLDALTAELKQQEHPDEKVLAAIESIKSSLQLFIAPPYASKDSMQFHHSHGVAIYFPSSMDAYRNDRDFRYYDPDDPHAIPFFKEHCWGRFLKTVLP